MPAKRVVIDNFVELKIFKRKGVKSIRLSIVGDGSVRVTQPRWLPYKAGIDFAMSRKQWIRKHITIDSLLRDGQLIGKSYQLQFIRSNAVEVRSRISKPYIRVHVPPSLAVSDEQVQTCARKAAIRALRHDTEDLLIPRLRELSNISKLDYTSVVVKQLKSRWGSCNQNKEITLSLYLIQLPWPLIDYVLLHELQHTEILAHGPRFWKALARHVHNLDELRKQVKDYQARII